MPFAPALYQPYHLEYKITDAINFVSNRFKVVIISEPIPIKDKKITDAELSTLARLTSLESSIKYISSTFGLDVFKHGDIYIYINRYASVLDIPEISIRNAILTRDNILKVLEKSYDDFNDGFVDGNGKIVIPMFKELGKNMSYNDKKVLYSGNVVPLYELENSKYTLHRILWSMYSKSAKDKLLYNKSRLKNLDSGAYFIEMEVFNEYKRILIRKKGDSRLVIALSSQESSNGMTMNISIDNENFKRQKISDSIIPDVKYQYSDTIFNLIEKNSAGIEIIADKEFTDKKICFSGINEQNFVRVLKDVCKLFNYKIQLLREKTYKIEKNKIEGQCKIPKDLSVLINNNLDQKVIRKSTSLEKGGLNSLAAQREQWEACFNTLESIYKKESKNQKTSKPVVDINIDAECNLLEKLVSYFILSSFEKEFYSGLDLGFRWINHLMFGNSVAYSEFGVSIVPYFEEKDKSRKFKFSLYGIDAQGNNNYMYSSWGIPIE